MLIAGYPWFLWAGFLLFVGVMLSLDLGVFHRKAHAVSMREAVTWTIVLFALAMVFNLGLYLFWDQLRPVTGSPSDHATAGEAAMAFFTGYLIEEALSVDNIFVFLMVFRYFQVPREYQHRVLFLGILGALIFRGIFIGVGAAVIERFAWTMVLFGAFLVFTGVKMGRGQQEKIDPDRNPVVRLLRRFLPVTPGYEGQKFLVKRDGRLWATPLLVTLVFIEVTDILFALDSIPAIFAITSDPLIVFTSNVFAILGLRALFFAVEGLVQLFHYLHYGLAVILVFIGGQMVYEYAQKHLVEGWHEVPIIVSLGVIAVVLSVSVIASLMFPPQAPPPEVTAERNQPTTPAPEHEAAAASTK